MSRVISTDVPNDLAERIEEAREGDESRSACVRRLIRAGLDAKQGGISELPTRRAIMAAGIILIFIATSPPEPLDLAIGAGALILLPIGIVLELAHLYANR